MKNSVEQIIKKVLIYNPKAETDIILDSFGVSSKAHEGQTRRSGEPYILHSIEVASILTDLKLDVPSIAAGLLHDTVEDTELSLSDVDERFGPEVSNLVEGVTKIGQIEFKTLEEKQAENFRKMLLSMSEDIRVILIKLADRLHNMRTLQHLSEVKQQRISQETLDIFAPIANRLGIGWMKIELEDLCFLYLKPQIYHRLVKKVARKREEGESFLQEIIEIIKKSIHEHELTGEVIGRYKHIYGIYQKMHRQGISFDEVYDLTGIRIITESKVNCYAIFGLLHSLWQPVPGRFKDYIGIPKSNRYQSLHTTVIGPKGNFVEFQIRTQEMHQIAEEGIAAHWKYKEKGKIDAQDDKVFSWLRQLVEWEREMSDHRQFMETLKVDLFPNVVYVFTPKGEVKEMMRGSTPVDFAYSIHTEIGHRCVGAKIDGKIVPLKTVLRSGNRIDILTALHHKPKRDWLKFVKTSRAKARIKHWIKIEERKRSLEIGRKLLDKELRRNHLNPVDSLKSEKIVDAAKELGIKGIENLIVAIGYGKISSHQVVRSLLSEDQLKESYQDTPLKQISQPQQGVKIKGLGDILINFSKCCNPVPGDRIIGFITRGRGLSIHAVDCPNMDALDYDRDRLVDVDWDTESNAFFPVKISVLTVDQPGLLASVSSCISGADANISHAQISTSDDLRAVLKFVVNIRNRKHLDQVIRKIEQVEGVLKASRVRRG